ncbi:hypothetical protein ACFL6U_21755 [Planctomycetota bacterium]
MKWGAIIRDIVIIWILTALAGFVIGIMGTENERFMLAIAFANMLFGSVGFCISGCLAKINRWKHLNHVALGVWLVGLVNVIIGPFPIRSWFFGIIALYIMMGLGGATSYLFVKSPGLNNSTESESIGESSVSEEVT